jgi:DNA-binding NarL/FixJ family response regulator
MENEIISLADLCKMFKVYKRSIRGYCKKCKIEIVRSNRGLGAGQGRSYDGIKRDDFARLSRYIKSIEASPLPSVKATLTRLKNLGLSQAQIAREIGVSESTITGWKNGRTNVKRKYMRDLYDLREEIEDNGL